MKMSKDLTIIMLIFFIFICFFFILVLLPTEKAVGMEIIPPTYDSAINPGEIFAWEQDKTFFKVVMLWGHKLIVLRHNNPDKDAKIQSVIIFIWPASVPANQLVMFVYQQGELGKPELFIYNAKLNHFAAMDMSLFDSMVVIQEGRNKTQKKIISKPRKREI